MFCCGIRRLIVSFESLQEINNDHFEIEASTDGVNFKKVGTLASKATNGNSDLPIFYEIRLNGTGLVGLWSMGVVMAFAIVLMALRRRNKLFRVFSMIAVISLLSVTSCSRKQSDLELSGKKNLWVRIAQVDKDGTKQYSKIVKAITED